MKLWKHTLLTTLSFLGIAGTVLYTSCEKDPCTQLSCKNSGSCSEGFCRCPTGYEGAECEFKTADRFVGVYLGYTKCNENPNLIDTLVVVLEGEPNKLAFYRTGSPNSFGRGTAVGYKIVVPDEVTGSTSRFMSGVVDGKKITIFQETSGDLGGTANDVCTFVGFRQ